jgi:hypothetical protein
MAVSEPHPSIMKFRYLSQTYFVKFRLWSDGYRAAWAGGVSGDLPPVPENLKRW